MYVEIVLCLGDIFITVEKFKIFASIFILIEAIVI